ncbi:unnamed protein product [Prorocentrum cordatum]|uniref:RING-type domain-containing protein n=1 Tax=Prorocentrum cordatum TaxID=2364126 RepID=A0ABN9VGD3_9DINO|nr:unnamed protein product [Polarella glacialis]
MQRDGPFAERGAFENHRRKWWPLLSPWIAVLCYLVARRCLSSGVVRLRVADGASGGFLRAGPVSSGFLARRGDGDALSGIQNATDAREASRSVVVPLPLLSYWRFEPPRQAVATLVPSGEWGPEAIRWWNAGAGRMRYQYKFCDQGPHLHLRLFGDAVLLGPNGTLPGFGLPQSASEAHHRGPPRGSVIPELHVTVPVPANVEPRMTTASWVVSDIPSPGERLTRLDPDHALRFTFIMSPSGQIHRRLFLLLWPLLMPKLFWARAPLIAKVALFAPLTIMVFHLVCFLAEVSRRHMAVRMYRRRRLARLGALRRAASCVVEVFSQEDCCICLADLERREDLTMLLPCKHVVHHACYSSWVSAPSYTVPHLRCPLCNSLTAGVAHPVAASDAGRVAAACPGGPAAGRPALGE